jgi:hypothetical protein
MMKRRFFIPIVIIFLLSIPCLLFAQYLGEGFKMEDIRSIVLDDFEDNDYNWQVSASRFAVEEFPKLKMSVEGAPIALSGSYAESENSYVMGVRASFTRKGYNRVWIYPESEIVIPGAAKKVDVWVWGANYFYNLEVHLRDYRGIVHKLSLGSLHFIGWRNLSVQIPRQIPQFIRYLPMEKPLTLVRFVIWTEPNERVDDYIIYFDHLKVLTDVYRERFDGDVLADESRTIWSSE